jgi:MoxR-like ATPase
MNTTSVPQQKVHQLRREINAALIEREVETDLVLAGLLSREHVLLVGEPGVAKSLLANCLAAALDKRPFTAHLTKDTARDVLFGPMDIQAYKGGRYERITRGSAAEAEVIILEEVFSAGPAVLDMLLLLLNERVYKEGLVERNCPLQFAMGVTNLWRPEGCEAGVNAFFDRFTIRREVKRIQTVAGRRRLYRLSLSGGIHPAKAVTVRLTSAELEQCRREAMTLPFTDDAWRAYEKIMEKLSGKDVGIFPGDRRSDKAPKVAAAYAYLNGAAEVRPEHLDILSSVLWVDEREQPAKCARVVAQIANPVGAEIGSLMAEARSDIDNCDVKDAASGASATKKLKELGKRLKTLSETGANGRAKKVYEFVSEECKRIYSSYMESI